MRRTGSGFKPAPLLTDKYRRVKSPVLGGGSIAPFKKPKASKLGTSRTKAAPRLSASVRAVTNPPARLHQPSNPSGGPKTPAKPRGGRSVLVAAGVRPRPAPRPIRSTRSSVSQQTADQSPATVQPGQSGQSDLIGLLAQQTQVENDAQAGAAAADRQRLQDFYGRMMGYLGGLPDQVGADYDKAAAQTAALGNASAQLLGAANPNNQVQNDLAAIGAPQAQQQQVTDTLRNAFQGAGAVLFQQGAAIPDQALLADKAAQQSYYRGMGGVAQQHFLDTLAQLASQDEGARSKLKSSQIDRLIQATQYEQETAAKQSQAEQEAQRYAQDFALKQQGLRQNEAVIRSQIGDRAFSQRAKRVALAQSQQRIGQGNAALAQSQQRIGLQGQSLALRQLQDDRSWQANLRRLGISDKGLQLRAAQLELGARKKTTGKQPKASDLQQMADLAYYGKQPKTDSSGNQTGGVTAVGYQAALFGMMNQGVPLAVAQRYLNQFYAPGERGRPAQSYQQRQARKRKNR